MVQGRGSGSLFLSLSCLVAAELKTIGFHLIPTHFLPFSLAEMNIRRNVSVSIVQIRVPPTACLSRS